MYWYFWAPIFQDLNFWSQIFLTEFFWSNFFGHNFFRQMIFLKYCLTFFLSSFKFFTDIFYSLLCLTLNFDVRSKAVDRILINYSCNYCRIILSITKHEMFKYLTTAHNGLQESFSSINKLKSSSETSETPVQNFVSTDKERLTGEEKEWDF